MANYVYGTLVVQFPKPVTVGKAGDHTVQDVLDASSVPFDPDTHMVVDGEMQELNLDTAISEGCLVLVVPIDLASTIEPQLKVPMADVGNPEEPAAAGA